MDEDAGGPAPEVGVEQEEQGDDRQGRPDSPPRRLHDSDEEGNTDGDIQRPRVPGLEVGDLARQERDIERNPGGKNGENAVHERHPARTPARGAGFGAGSVAVRASGAPFAARAEAGAEAGAEAEAGARPSPVSRLKRARALSPRRAS